MEETPTEIFAGIIELAQTTFEQVTYSTDYTPERAILRLQGIFKSHRVFIVELIEHRTHKYAYYALREDWVEIGFDNSADPDAIRLKYGKIGSEHAGERVPHLHRANKTEMELTQEMTFEKFVEWLRNNFA